MQSELEAILCWLVIANQLPLFGDNKGSHALFSMLTWQMSG
jgi:hypothetical protein